MRGIPLTMAVGWVAACGAGLAGATQQPEFSFQTNGAGVYRTWITHRTNVSPNPRFGYTNHLAQSNRLPAEVFKKLNERWAREPQFVTNTFSFTNAEFLHLVPESLTHILLTNFISRTNGRTTRIWSRREHPVLWPMAGPLVEWDTRSLVWGMKGMTALSPCWQQEGASGQVPITLLTPRHGYTRGHGMGADGFTKRFNGKKVWFVTRENKVISAKVANAVVRFANGLDYTILFFKDDLPPSIEPIRVVSEAMLRTHYPWPPGSMPVVLLAEQEGNVSVELPGLSRPAHKGGDSGSPNLLPFFDELVFMGGRTTSPPTPRMQEDLDELCRMEGVDPKRYQMQWVDLSKYPAY